MLIYRLLIVLIEVAAMSFWPQNGSKDSVKGFDGVEMHVVYHTFR